MKLTRTSWGVRLHLYELIMVSEFFLSLAFVSVLKNSPKRTKDQ